MSNYLPWVVFSCLIMAINWFTTPEVLPEHQFAWYICHTVCFGGIAVVFTILFLLDLFGAFDKEFSDHDISLWEAFKSDTRSDLENMRLFSQSTISRVMNSLEGPPASVKIFVYAGGVRYIYAFWAYAHGCTQTTPIINGDASFEDQRIEVSIDRQRYLTRITHGDAW